MLLISPYSTVSFILYHSHDAHPHLEIWDGELAAGGGQVGFGNGALEFLYTD